MGTIALQIPQAGSFNSTEDPKIASDFNTLQTLANGNIDTNNLSPTAGITAAQLVPGAVFLALRTVSTNTTAAAGQLINATGVTTITLPAPASNAIVGLFSGSTALTINAAGGSIIGAGATAGVASIQLSMNGAHALLMADGSNWFIVGGQQDTGWVSLASSFPANVSATAGAYAPSVRLLGDRVMLKGAVSTAAGFTGGGLLTVPALFRPAATIGTATTGAAGLTITTAGVLGNVGANITVFLDAITYSVN